MGLAVACSSQRSSGFSTASAPFTGSPLCPVPLLHAELGPWEAAHLRV